MKVLAGDWPAESNVNFKTTFSGSCSAMTRAHVVAAVGYEARRLALALEPLCPADNAPPPESLADTLPPLDLAATLPARALRHLFDHSAIHLDVCWRDLPGKSWDETITDPRRETVTMRDLPRRRALTLWRQVLALGNGASLRDAPPHVRKALSDESAGA